MFLFFRHTYHSSPSADAFCLTRLYYIAGRYLYIYIYIYVTGQRLFLSLIARAFGVTGARSRVPESTRRAKAEDTATISVGTSSSRFPLLSFSLAHCARLPLIILSGWTFSLGAATHTRHRGNVGEWRCTVANVNATV